MYEIQSNIYTWFQTLFYNVYYLAIPLRAVYTVLYVTFFKRFTFVAYFFFFLRVLKTE